MPRVLLLQVCIVTVFGDHRANPQQEFEDAIQKRHAIVRVPFQRARRVAEQAKNQPRTAWPDVVPLTVIRNRGNDNAMEAILAHLVDHLGMSLDRAGQAVGLSKSAVNTYLRRRKGLDSPPLQIPGKNAARRGHYKRQGEHETMTKNTGSGNSGKSGGSGGRGQGNGGGWPTNNGTSNPFGGGRSNNPSK